MKRLDDHTTIELAALTDQQYAELLDLECAYEGAPLLPNEPLKPLKPDTEPDQAFYRVDAELMFTSAEIANQVLNLAQRHSRHTIKYYARWDGPKGAEPVDSDQGTVSVVKLWSPEHYAAHRKELEAYERIITDYEGLKRRYDEANKAREHIRERVRDAVAQATEAVAHVNQLHLTFNRYLELANGDRDVALNFLRKLGQWSDETINQELTDGQATAAHSEDLTQE